MGKVYLTKNQTPQAVYKKRMDRALRMLEHNGELFCDMVDELDSWNGFADGFRCWPMAELDELCYGMSFSKLLDEKTDDFNLNDSFVYFSIWGIESTDNKLDLYKNNTNAGEVLDNILDYANHLNFPDREFEDLIDEIIELRDMVQE